MKKLLLIKCTITLEVELSLFSFLKINMYKDLGNNTDKIKNHLVIRTIAGESASNDAVDINGFDHDAVEPEEVFCVVDADSSQQDAIHQAKCGVSFVLQGPPGTGKSQTITNIIAELMADGKRVLFVSEKMAALEVVYKRLTTAGLGDFCLTLHSHNAKRREILTQLEKSLELALHHAALANSVSNKLVQLKYQRKILNDYSRELHTIIKPLGKTIFHINGQLAALNSVANIPFSPKNSASYSLADFVDRTNLFEELSRIVAESGYQKDNPWRGCTLTLMTNQFRQQFSISVEKILSLTDECQKIYNSVNGLFGHVKTPSYAYNRILLDLLYAAESLLKAEQNHNKASEVHDKQFQLYTIANNNWIVEQEKYRSIYNDAIFDIESNDMLLRFRTEYHSIMRIFNTKYWADRKAILACKKTAKKLTYADMLMLLDRLSATGKIRAEYKSKYNALGVAKDRLKSSEVAYTALYSKLSNAVEGDQLSAEYVKHVREHDGNILSQTKNLYDKLNDWTNKAQQPFETVTSFFKQQQALLSKPFGELCKLLKNCIENFSSLRQR